MPNTPTYALPYPSETDTADVPRDIQALAVRLDAVLPNVGMPTGGGMDWFAAAAPSGFLLCDGSAISRSTFAALFAVLGTTWGAGDGSSTFNLPDCRARVVVGLNPAGPNHATIGSNDGTPIGNRRVLHGHTIAGLTASHSLSLPQHGHGISDPGHFHGFVSYDSGGPAGVPQVAASQNPSGSDRSGAFGSWAGPVQGAYTGISVGGITSAPAINGGVTLGGSVGVPGTTDGPSFVTVAKVIKT